MDNHPAARCGIWVAAGTAVLVAGVFFAVWLGGFGNQLSIRNVIIPKTNLSLAFCEGAER